MRKFNPQNLFLSVLHLATSTNNDGSLRALHKTWSESGLKLKDTPAKSSLSVHRQKVSHEFFKDIFEQDLDHSSVLQKTFKGHFIYAADGDHLDLPASEDVLANGYRGFPMGKQEETYYPKMYTVHFVDLLSGETRYFSQSNKSSEVPQARALIGLLEKNSITLYDRHHLGFETAWTHEAHGSYYFIRVPHDNPCVNREIKKFIASSSRSKWIDLPMSLAVPKSQRTKTLRVRLIKVKNKKTKKDIVFMTNAPEGMIRNKDAGMFYLKRWGIESTFKNLTDTLKMNQWHSLKLNGILQEIYALLWLVNNVRRCERAAQPVKKWLDRPYRKANFKLLFTLVLDHFEMVVRGEKRKLLAIISYWRERSSENRCHLSRNYPRQVKRHGKKYTNASRVGRRPTAEA